MNIIALYLDRPGYCMQPLVNFFRSQGHSVQWTPLRLGGVGARIQQLRAASRELHADFDVAITTEPLCALGLRLRRIAKLQIYWRIDYRPDRYLGLSSILNGLVVSGIDKVWSIVPDTNYRHVPLMLGPEEFLERESRSSNQVLWTGPDYTNQLSKEVKESITSLEGVSLEVVSWRNQDAKSDSDLRNLLLESKLGLALYGAGKRYSDPARVKRFLAAGLPVVTNDSYPFAQELQEEGAGVCLPETFTPEEVKDSVTYCLREDTWPTMSANALILAKNYATSRRWLEL